MLGQRSASVSGSVMRFLDARIGLAEILVTAVLLAVGANLLASAIALGASRLVLTSLGVLFLLGGLGYFWNKRFPRVSTQRSVGKIAADYRKRELVDMSKYPFAFWVARAIRAALLESPALEDQVKEASHSIERDPEACEVIREAAEWFVVFQLLDAMWEEYPGHAASDDASLAHRDPAFFQALGSNHLVALLSASPETRDTMGRAPNDGATLVIHPDGSLFLGLEATLPKEASLVRPDKRTIRLSLPTLTLDIRTEIVRDEDTAPLFETLYLGREPFSTIFIGVSVATELRLKTRLPFLRRPSSRSRAWREYLWVTQFVESLHATVSFPTFLDYLGWHVAPTVSHLLARLSAVQGEER